MFPYLVWNTSYVILQGITKDKPLSYSQQRCMYIGTPKKDNFNDNLKIFPCLGIRECTKDDDIFIWNWILYKRTLCFLFCLIWIWVCWYHSRTAVLIVLALKVFDSRQEKIGNILGTQHSNSDIYEMHVLWYRWRIINVLY